MDSLRISILDDFKGLLFKHLDKRLDQKLASFIMKLAPSNFPHMPSNSYDYVHDMPSKETYKQGGSHPSFPF
jgi:hypothetical protein